MKRTTAPGNVANLHVEEDPSSGQRATEIAADVLNAHQEEIANVIEATGQALNGADNTQLLTAIRALIGGVGSRNALINGDFQLWQRALSHLFTTGTAAYTADRWRVSPGTGNTQSLVVARAGFTLGQTEVPGDPRFMMVWNQAAGLDGSTNPTLAQRIEHGYSYNSRTITVSFWAKLTTGTSWVVTPKIRQHFGSGGSSDVTVSGSAKTITATWTRFSQVFNVPSTAGKTFVNPDHYLEVFLEMTKATAVVAAFADFQVEVGNAASAFERLPPQTVLSLARRFYEKSYEVDTDPGTATFLGSESGEESGTRFQSAQGRFKTPKRLQVSAPAVTWYNPNDGTPGEIRWGASDVAVTTTDYTCTETTGYPNVGSSQSNNKAYVHWTCDAEL